jgi:hypothetical protein
LIRPRRSADAGSPASAVELTVTIARIHRMKFQSILALAILFATPVAAAAQDAPASSTPPALTIYNQDFAVVRQIVPLDLKAGLNHVTVNDITLHVEPDSVILRDPTGKRALQVREQNYRADPLTQDLLLNYYEGQTISFQVTRGDHVEIVPGKIIRSGYVPRGQIDYPYGPYNYYPPQGTAASAQPLIEVDGKLQFGLPGLPLFPALPDDSILKPTLDWTLETDKAGPLNAELAYITDGMTWSASYNVVAPEKDNGAMDVVGWVTMDNESGKDFPNARIKLMAGDVNKIQSRLTPFLSRGANGYAAASDLAAPSVTEKTFDEYHLYTLQYPTTLRDRETKQVEFVHANGVKYKEIYVYDGLEIDPQRYNGWSYDNIRGDQEYGTQSNTKVAVMREFVNSKANGLGIPLPKGRVRFYRQDADGQLEFTGENEIDHTPKDETLRIYTGNAFDLTGERTQTNYTLNQGAHTVDESFAIKVANHKATPVEMRIVEHLYRGPNWTISVHSDPFVKTDAHTIEFHVPLAPNETKTVTYTVHYTW